MTLKGCGAGLGKGSGPASALATTGSITWKGKHKGATTIQNSSTTSPGQGGCKWGSSEYDFTGTVTADTSPANLTGTRNRLARAYVNGSGDVSLVKHTVLSLYSSGVSPTLNPGASGGLRKVPAVSTPPGYPLGETSIPALHGRDGAFSFFAPDGESSNEAGARPAGTSVRSNRRTQLSRGRNRDAEHADSDHYPRIAEPPRDADRWQVISRSSLPSLGLIRPCPRMREGTSSLSKRGAGSGGCGAVSSSGRS